MGSARQERDVVNRGAPYREGTPRAPAHPRNLRYAFFACALIASVVSGWWALRRRAASGPPPGPRPAPMPGFAVTVDPPECERRPRATTGRRSIYVVRQLPEHGEDNVTIESNGRWQRWHMLPSGQTTPGGRRDLGCVAPARFAPLFARFAPDTPVLGEAQPDRPDPACIHAYTDEDGQYRRLTSGCFHELAEEIFRETLPLAPSEPQHGCGGTFCEFVLRIEHASYGHRPAPAGRAVRLRRNGSWECHPGSMDERVQGTIRPAKPVFVWLLGPDMRPFEPPTMDSEWTLRYAEARNGERRAVRSMPFESAVTRWNQLARHLDPACLQRSDQ